MRPVLVPLQLEALGSPVGLIGALVLVLLALVVVRVVLKLAVRVAIVAAVVAAALWFLGLLGPLRGLAV